MDYMTVLAPQRELDVGDGRSLRILSAWTLLAARREAMAMAQEGKTERALCSNACILARALWQGDAPEYGSGRAVLEALSARQITMLAKQWAEFNRAENPSVDGGTDELKKAWSTRLTRAFSGVCSAVLARCRLKRGRMK